MAEGRFALDLPINLGYAVLEDGRNRVLALSVEGEVHKAECQPNASRCLKHEGEG